MASRKIYPPGIFFHLAIGLCALLAWYLLRTGGEAKHVLLGAGMLVMAVGLALFAWTLYVIDGSGLTRYRISGRRHWSWERLGGVSSTELERDSPIEVRGSIGATSRIYFKGSQGYMRREVRGPSGEIVLRISPWTWRRDDLAKEIRQRTRPTRTRRDR